MTKNIEKTFEPICTCLIRNNIANFTTKTKRRRCLVRNTIFHETKNIFGQ